MSVIVHGRATSSNVQAVMWGAAELGLHVDRRDVGGRFGGTDTPAYLAMNPMGLVPVLEDGETVLFESAAILRYLVARYGQGQVPSEPRDDMWAEWAKGTLCRAFTEPVFWKFYRTSEELRDMDAVMTALSRFEGYLAIVMRARGDETWIANGRFGLADVWVGHLLFRYFTLDLKRDVPEGAHDYYQRLTERPAYREHVMVDYSELKGRLSF